MQETARSAPTRSILRAKFGTVDRESRICVRMIKPAEFPNATP
jgi:hypothetical protein